MAKEEAHVDRAVERIAGKVEIEAGAQLTAGDPALEDLARRRPARIEITVDEGPPGLGIGLRLHHDRADELADAAAEEPGHAAQLGFQIRDGRGALGKRVLLL